MRPRSSANKTLSRWQCASTRRIGLFTDYFYQNPLRSPAVEFAIIDLLPWPEIEPAAGHRYDDLAAHDVSLDMGVAVVLAGPVMPVARCRLMRRQAFKKVVKIRNKAALGVVYVDRGGYMHGVDQAEPFVNAAFCYDPLDSGRDIDIFPSILRVKSKILG